MPTTRGLPARPRPRTAQPRLLKAASKSSPQLLKSASLEADGLKWRMINEKAAESLLITASLGGETAAGDAYADQQGRVDPEAESAATWTPLPSLPSREGRGFFSFS